MVRENMRSPRAVLLQCKFNTLQSGFDVGFELLLTKPAWTI